MESTHDISKRSAIIGLFIVLAIATWMRFDGLGQFSFWTDELYHVIAAQSMMEGGEPVIPAHGMYWRSFMATAMTIASFSLFGVSEWSARLPFALTSLIFLALAYKILAIRFTRLLALITVLFLALTPQFLQVGRECRMYAPFVLLYFLGVFAVYRAVESLPDGSRRRPIGIAIGLLMAAVVFALAMSLQYLAFNFGLSFALYCLLMSGYLIMHHSLGCAIRSRYLFLLFLMVLGVIMCVFALPTLVTDLLDLAHTPKAWDTRGHPAPFCLWFINYYYPTLWFVYPLGAVLLIRRYGRLGVFILCAFLPVLLAHMFFFTSRIAERYLLYILPFFFLTSACVIESLVWVLVGWIRDLRASGAAVMAATATLCTIPAAWLFLHPWLNTSRELRQYGVGPDWKQIAPALQEACETGIVITNWPREVMYYGGRFPDYFATQSYEHFSNSNHEVAIGEQVIAVNYLLDAASLDRVLESDREVYFVTTDWAYGNDAFLSEAMREVIRRDMQEIAKITSGDDRAVILKTYRSQ